jgi:hypothetical protein
MPADGRAEELVTSGP